MEIERTTFGTITIDSDPYVQQLAREEDRPFSRYLLNRACRDPSPRLVEFRRLDVACLRSAAEIRCFSYWIPDWPRRCRAISWGGSAWTAAGRSRRPAAELRSASSKTCYCK